MKSKTFKEVHNRAAGCVFIIPIKILLNLDTRLPFR